MNSKLAHELKKLKKKQSDQIKQQKQIKHKKMLKQHSFGDRANQMIKTELWPIAKSLEIQTKSGIVLKRDKDGSVLRHMQEKSIELIHQYADHKSKIEHLQMVQDASDYQTVIKLMTNVFMYHIGHRVL